MPATLRTVRGFIETATHDDLGAITEAIQERVVALRAEREATTSVGAEVEFTGLSPTSLNGLRGTVQVLTTARGQRRCSVLLDVGSTKNLRSQSNRFAATVSPETKRHLFQGVPMAACLPVES